MERSIRQQRNNNSYTPAKTVAVKTATIVAPQVKEIRQQRNRVSGYYVQVAAVSKISGGLLLRNTLTQKLRRSNVFVEQASDRANLYRVLVGPIANDAGALALVQQIAQLGHGQGVVIRP